MKEFETAITFTAPLISSSFGSSNKFFFWLTRLIILTISYVNLLTGAKKQWPAVTLVC